jgi:hypothetical protein
VAARNGAIGGLSSHRRLAKPLDQPLRGEPAAEAEPTQTRRSRNTSNDLEDAASTSGEPSSCYSTWPLA